MTQQFLKSLSPPGTVDPKFSGLQTSRMPSARYKFSPESTHYKFYLKSGDFLIAPKGYKYLATFVTEIFQK